MAAHDDNRFSDSDISSILKYIEKKRDVDFSAYRTDIIRKRVFRELNSHDFSNVAAFLGHLDGSPSALNSLIDALTINFSRFFRDSLVFEYIADQVLPVILFNKKRDHHHALRIWSAGCATGEEPYSVALLVRDQLGIEANEWQVHIFATDIDHAALEYAKKGIYTHDSIQNVRYRMVEEYFTRTDDLYRIDDRIKALVDFSDHDILDKTTHVPPQSIYGHFDMVLCRNLLIYFNPSSQSAVVERLYRSIASGGYLVLGMAETPPAPYSMKMRTVNRTAHIYQK